MYQSLNYLEVLPVGRGKWKVTIIYYNKAISCITNNSEAIDDYKSNDWEKDGRICRVKRGFKALREEVIRKNKH